MSDSAPTNRRDLSRMVQSTYDQTTEAYERLFAEELAVKPLDRILLQRFAEEVTGGGLAADVGCGPGHVGAFVAQFGPRLCGIDLSMSMAALAHARNPNMPGIVASMLGLPVADASLSGIVAFYSIIHLLRADVPAAFQEFARALRPGAPLLVAAHAGEGDVYVQEVFGAPLPLYATLFSREELEGYAQEAGFALDEVHERPPYPSEVDTSRIYLLAHRR